MNPIDEMLRIMRLIVREDDRYRSAFSDRNTEEAAEARDFAIDLARAFIAGVDSTREK